MIASEWLTGAGLVILGIVTGFVGTNTGGSVFLTVPVMIGLGIAPQSAVATARLASLGTMLAGLRHFHQYGKIDYAAAFPAALLGLLGALAGASLLIEIDPLLLHKIIGALTLLLVLLSLIKQAQRSSSMLLHDTYQHEYRLVCGTNLALYFGVEKQSDEYQPHEVHLRLNPR
ncbi:TSUP family transporter [Pseudomonas lactucae]|uniref:Probable membrane transporter protein n=2 Tax=Pseudomonas lactucae TaxID=2813360 RepID=A0A9X1C5S2_9PSED|nr:TSUP family transporter [Pseudomonas lactucae]MBN2975968.1 sulfite exporter TauE/SafE family protein [Pseudomonas lactucae]MBN2985622.1 sulfite exporter TauE/SafE family protein [Pseudomonas lactucae]